MASKTLASLYEERDGYLRQLAEQKKILFSRLAVGPPKIAGDGVFETARRRSIEITKSLVTANKAIEVLERAAKKEFGGK